MRYFPSTISPNLTRAPAYDRAESIILGSGLQRQGLAISKCGDCRFRTQDSEIHKFVMRTDRDLGDEFCSALL